MNFLRGFNRVFAVLTVLWLLLIFVGAPINQVSIKRDYERYVKQMCAGSKECLANSIGIPEKKSEYGIADAYKHLFVDEFWEFMGLAFVAPLLVYAACRLIFLVFDWVYRGFAGK